MTKKHVNLTNILDTPRQIIFRIQCPTHDLMKVPPERPDWTLFRKTPGYFQWEVIPGGSGPYVCSKYDRSIIFKLTTFNPLYSSSPLSTCWGGMLGHVGSHSITGTSSRHKWKIQLSKYKALHFFFCLFMFVLLLRVIYKHGLLTGQRKIP